MSTDARKSQFKKGIDSSSARRRRNDVTINIRKQKKEQGLAKRRNCQLQNFVQAEASASTAAGRRTEDGGVPEQSPRARRRCVPFAVLLPPSFSPCNTPFSSSQLLPSHRDDMVPWT